MRNFTRLVIYGLLLMSMEMRAQTCDFFVGGYIPNYRNPTTVDYSKLTHTFYAFANTNNDGDLLIDNLPVFEQFKTASTGKQRFLSLAGAGRDAVFSSMSSSVVARANFVTNCVNACLDNNLQGIDVDWEAITTPADSVKYGALMRELAAALHEKDLTLIATLGYGGYGGDHYNVGALKKADWIQLMVYDQTGTWSESPFGNHASYQHMLDAIEYWNDRGYTDLSKIVIGLPFYGYTFNSEQGGLATSVTYSEIANAHPSMACSQDDYGLTVFNGPETIRQKVEYVMSHGLKGVMIWEMSQDLNSAHEKSLLQAISKEACGLSPACTTVVSVSDETPSEAVILLTNPVDKFLTISFRDTGSVSELKIMDVTGKILLTKTNSFETQEVIDVSGQASGLYLLTITLGDRKTVLKKFIKL